MSGCDAFHALTTAGMPLSQSVIVRCTTWLEPDAAEDEDAVDEDAVDGDEDEPELQAASASATAVAAPAVTAPRFENGLLTFCFLPCEAIGIWVTALLPG